MGYTLEQFAEACHQILADDPGIEGRRKICAILQDVLKDEAFIAANLGEGTPGPGLGNLRPGARRNDDD